MLLTVFVSLTSSVSHYGGAASIFELTDIHSETDLLLAAARNGDQPALQNQEEGITHCQSLPHDLEANQLPEVENNAESLNRHQDAQLFTEASTAA